MLGFMLCALATWRISSLLVREDGPGDVFVKLRRIIGVRYDEFSVPYGTNIIAQALICVWCTSVWVGIFVGVAYVVLYINPAYLPIYAAIFCLSCSAAAILIDEYIQEIGNRKI